MTTNDFDVISQPAMPPPPPPSREAAASPPDPRENLPRGEKR